MCAGSDPSGPGGAGPGPQKSQSVQKSLSLARFWHHNNRRFVHFFRALVPPWVRVKFGPRQRSPNLILNLVTPGSGSHSNSGLQYPDSLILGPLQLPSCLVRTQDSTALLGSAGVTAARFKTRQLWRPFNTFLFGAIATALVTLYNSKR